MEEHHPRIQPQAHPLNRNLARQPYAPDDGEDLPLEEDDNVVPMSGKPRSPDMMAEPPLTSNPGRKRKASGTTTKKGRSASSKQKTARWSPQTVNLGPYAEELKRLEAQADRINQILAERARKRAVEQSQSISGKRSPLSEDPPSAYQPDPWLPTPSSSPSPPLEEVDTENLKRHARQIRLRLMELESSMDQAESLTEPPTPGSDNTPSRQSPSPAAKPVPEGHHPFPPTYSYSQAAQGQSQSPSAYDPSQSPPPMGDPTWQQANYEAWQTAQELRQWTAREQGATYGEPELRQRPRSSSHQSLLRQLILGVRWLTTRRFLELPDQFLNRLGDAAIWLAIAGVSRVGLRYLAGSLPWLAPGFTFLMLVPAVLAVFLAFFVPRVGWVPYYRLFLIMLGLLLGGKL
jgi:hypothetical protein